MISNRVRSAIINKPGYQFDREVEIGGFLVQYDVTNGDVDIVSITADPDKDLLDFFSEEAIDAITATIDGTT